MGRCCVVGSLAWSFAAIASDTLSLVTEWTDEGFDCSRHMSGDKGSDGGYGDAGHTRGRWKVWGRLGEVQRQKVTLGADRADGVDEWVEIAVNNRKLVMEKNGGGCSEGPRIGVEVEETGSLAYKRMTVCRQCRSERGG